jgi:CRP/FNR family transcriptional regulator, anaerobic regulatory protein
MEKITDNCSNCKLLNASIFNNCTEGTLQEISRKTQAIFFEKGEAIIEEGNKFKGIYCINSGLSKIVKHKGKKNEFILWFAKPGEAIGLRAYIHNEAHTYSAIAITKCSACFIPENEIKTIINNNPSVSIEIMKALCKRIHFVEERISDVIEKKVESRLAEFLLILISEIESTTAETTSEINYTMEELANITGTTKNYIYKILIAMEKRKFIGMEKEKMVLLNKKGLRDIADGKKRLN